MSKEYCNCKIHKNQVTTELRRTAFCALCCKEINPDSIAESTKLKVLKESLAEAVKPVCAKNIEDTSNHDFDLVCLDCGCAEGFCDCFHGHIVKQCFYCGYRE